MSSAAMYKAMFGIYGVFAAVALPYYTAVLSSELMGNVVAGVALSAVVAYELLSCTIAVASVAQLLPDSLPLGPSFTLGNGMMSIGMLIAPLALAPGLVWWFVLPFDEQGYVDPGAMLELDMDAIEAPHHRE